MFLSKSLDTFMGESLVPLLKLRETMDLSWDGANETLIANRALSFEPRPRQPPGTQPQPQGSGQGMEQRKALGSVLPKEKAEDEFTVLVSDHLSESATQERSLPLVAMQFAMHYFVRCPEFCLRCHRRLDDKFDAIMPYVCSNSLCLFQYLTMGLGPNVENDIIRKPVVVDLLISLFYASIQRRDQLARLKKHEDPAIRDYPVGLQLRVPALFSPEVALHKPIKVKVTADPTVFLVEQAGDLGRLFVSQWVAFQRSGDNIDSKERISHALIIGVDHDKLSVTMQVMSHSSSHLSIPSYTKDGEVELYPYELDCDVLDDSSKSSAMSLLLGTLPSIRAIRSYLTSHPHVTFRSYSRLSPAAATLLQWIISSNRSCIQEIDSSRAERISGMGPWIQFRFLSDKEVRFSRALQQVAASGKLGATPTIFAWHGSPLENWHSILRNGLNYRDTRHGRAHGHGVYFSDRFNVSTLYTNEHDRTWPNSEINMSSAVSLNEIINSPQGFLCQKPCYVIPQLDWHQCRYLFVRSNRLDSQGDADDPPPNVPILEQAPGLEVTGPENSHIQIPVAAMPLRSVPALGQTWSRKTVVRSLAEHSEDEDSEDLEFIMDEEKQPTSEDQQAHESSAKTALTGFKPGDLDLATLPRLEPPAWATATATRVMGREVKRLQKLQAGTPLHELGWYIDFDKLTNMFQWIVQFHSFDLALPLARDMEEAGVTSVVMEVRFGKEHPLTPPFIRVVRPRFLPFLQGGGGHVTAGGAMCMELLTNTGWTPANSMESVLLQVRMALCNLDPQPARLNQDIGRGDQNEDYGMGEAIEAYVRAARAHGWEVPRGLMASIGYPR
ncbi:hypothetical protein QBC33DRAFT_520930 [Phialemonium atrogriseum]|uniref:UBC core domain-containing protein n=1 Tax=Phialemonium atrogriseum TaxID=1093897 RepID=A0AAJ0FL73_9PEZI|nr:uncharacterized protein QBC33DRAFT_520930 [Phialemonium atrogriseum]KAK1772346.1 hypothetical protein QBC33DRAFT_520930 [Phialemonium atrogriseum]